MRAKKQIILRRDSSGLSEILFALRKYLLAKGKSAYKKQSGKVLNTIRKLSLYPFQNPKQFSWTKKQISSRLQVSTILVQERSRATKLEGAFKKRRGVLLEQSNHTVTFVLAGKKQTTITSERDIGNTPEMANKPKRQQNKIGDTLAKWQLQASSHIQKISQ